MGAIIIEEEYKEEPSNACVVDENVSQDDFTADEDDEEEAEREGDAEHIIKNADGTVTVKLQYPVEVIYKNGTAERKETVTSLTFNRARGEDLIVCGKFRNDAERGSVLMARMARVSDVIMRKMDAADFDRCGRAVKDFFPKSRKTGKKRS